MDSIYEFFIEIEDENIDMIYDVLRLITLQCITQIMFCLNNPGMSFFNSVFIQTVIYLSIGVIFYWLVIRKLLKIKNKDNIEDKNV